VKIALSRNHAVALGSAVVSTAVFGVPPKTFAVSDSAPFGVGEIVIELAGETPAKATETVALPNASLHPNPRLTKANSNENRI
jgi:hypothetical protein